MIVCKCKSVTSKEIKKFLSKHTGSTLVQLTDATGASTGCGHCRTVVCGSFEHFKKTTPSPKQLSLEFLR